MSLRSFSLDMGNRHVHQETQAALRRGLVWWELGSPAHKQPRPAKWCEWEPLGIRSSRLQDDHSPHQPLATLRRDDSSSRTIAVPKVLSHRNYEMINVYCFKLQSLGIIYYTALDNKYSTIFTLNWAAGMVSQCYKSTLQVAELPVGKFKARSRRSDGKISQSERG